MDTLTGYCTDCGQPLADGRCPVHYPMPEQATNAGSHMPVTRPSAPIIASSIALLLSLISLGLSLRPSGSDSTLVDRTEQRLTELHDQMIQRQRVVDEQLQTITGRFDAIPDLVALAATVRPTVFKIKARGGTGTGFVWSSSDGGSLLLTNYHVVADGWRNGRKAVTVTSGGQRFDGRVTKVSIAEDLALIEVDQGLPSLGHSATLPKTGSTVLAIGAPLGLNGTVTSGIVSGTHKGQVQFSAAISPGSSGSPLVDGNGDVVGIVSAKYIGPGAEGLGFAVPVKTVCDVFPIC